MNYLSYFENGMTGASYLDLVQKVVSENKTTGPNQSEDLAHYTQMNLKRIERWNIKGELSTTVKNTLSSWDKKMHWLVITEAWCGDAAHVTPFLQKMADESINIDIRYVLRDENLPLMDEFLTNGGRSIPKLIALDDEGNVLFSWGPRPQELQEWYLESKKNDMTFDEVKIYLQKWYNKDKGAQIQSEIVTLMQKAI